MKQQTIHTALEIPGAQALSKRSREIFRHIVDAYVSTGAPIGSRTISRIMGMSLSPATVRNVMADLEELGLLYAPHTSAGRLPTEAGMRLFVHGLLEHGNLTKDERSQIDAQCVAAGRSLPEVLEEATGMLSGLSRCAGLVVASETEEPLKHIEFVALGPGRALVVLVFASGTVEKPHHRRARGLARLLPGRGHQLPLRAPGGSRPGTGSTRDRRRAQRSRKRSSIH